jgi:hypothetical protein
MATVNTLKYKHPENEAKNALYLPPAVLSTFKLHLKKLHTKLLA